MAVTSTSNLSTYFTATTITAYQTGMTFDANMPNPYSANSPGGWVASTGVVATNSILNVSYGSNAANSPVAYLNEQWVIGPGYRLDLSVYTPGRVPACFW